MGDERGEIATTTSSMRVLLAIAGAFVVIIGVPLYFVPQNSDEYFSWSVTSISAAFLGGAYLSAAVIEFSAARKRIWANARIAVPAVLVFTTLTLVVTLGNTEQYNYGSPTLVQNVGTWVWLIVYVTVPPIMLAVLVIQFLRDGVDPKRAMPLPVWLKGLFAIVGVALFAGGLALMLDPAVSSWLWPWRLTALTARSFGAWLIGFGIAFAHMAREDDWIRIRPATAAFASLGTLQLLTLARFADDVKWSAPQSWAYIAVLVGLVVLGIGGWIISRPNSRDESPTAETQEAVVQS